MAQEIRRKNKVQSKVIQLVWEEKISQIYFSQPLISWYPWQILDFRNFTCYLKNAFVVELLNETKEAEELTEQTDDSNATLTQG